MQHRIILPGATTLTRLISEVREKATLRLWNKLALIPSAEQRSQLEMLLGPTDCSRLSLLESLKKGPVTISGPAFNEAIEPRQPDGCKLKTAPVRPVVAARSAEYVCSEDLFY